MNSPVTPLQMRLAPNLLLARCEHWARLQFDTPRPALSSAPVNGGLTQCHQWLNVKVSGDPVHTDQQEAQTPADTVSALCATQRWKGNTVAMLTAASMNSLRVRYLYLHGQLVLVAVTSGLANARRVGDTADYRQFADAMPTTPAPPTGTINIAVVTDVQLDSGVMVEAMMVVTEAKAAVLLERQWPSPVSGRAATGTGTDAMAIFAGTTGPAADYAGKHTLLGEVLGLLSLSAIGDSVDQTGDTVVRLEAPQRRSSSGSTHQNNAARRPRQ